jgi:hypothetical protein
MDFGDGTGRKVGLLGDVPQNPIFFGLVLYIISIYFLGNRLKVRNIEFLLFSVQFYENKPRVPTFLEFYCAPAGLV